MVKNLPSSAGNPGLISGLGTRIPHAWGQLSPDTATTGPMCSGAQAPHREGPHTQWRPRAATKMFLKKI